MVYFAHLIQPIINYDHILLDTPSILRIFLRTLTFMTSDLTGSENVDYNCVTDNEIIRHYISVTSSVVSLVVVWYAER